MSMMDKLRAADRPFGAPRPKVSASPAPVDKESLEALSHVLAGVSGLSKNHPIAQGFIDAGEQIAESLERIGDVCFKEGERRKNEYYKIAMVTRDKCRYQAAEALDFAKELEKLHDMQKPSANNILNAIRPKDITPHHLHTAEAHDAEQAEERADDDPHDGPAEP